VAATQGRHDTSTDDIKEFSEFFIQIAWNLKVNSAAFGTFSEVRSGVALAWREG
jgi:hypothetical protein